MGFTANVHHPIPRWLKMLLTTMLSNATSACCALPTFFRTLHRSQMLWMHHQRARPASHGDAVCRSLIAELSRAVALPGSCWLNALSQARAPGHLGTLPRVTGCGHGIVGLEPELLAVRLGRESVGDVEVAPQGSVLLAADQADEVVIVN
jgi:hypothetical protein